MHHRKHVVKVIAYPEHTTTVVVDVLSRAVATL